MSATADPHARVAELLPLYANGAALDPEARREVEDHLATCAACAEELAAWAAVRDALRSSAPAAPGFALLDRVWAEVDGAPPPPGERLVAPAAPPRRRARRARRLAGPALRVAAAAAVVAGVVLGLRGMRTGEPERRTVLLAAAEATEEARTARVAVGGSFELDLDPGTLGVPDDAPPVVAAVTGDGELAFPDRSRTRIGWEVTRPLVGAGGRVIPIEGERTETIRVGDTVYRRTGTGRWRLEDGRSGGFVSRTLLGADLGRVLASAEGDIERLDDVQRDGARLRRYRFGVAPSAFGPEALPLAYTAEVGIDTDDGRLRELRVLATGHIDEPPGRLSMDVTLRLADFGAPVSVEPPPEDQLAP